MVNRDIVDDQNPTEIFILDGNSENSWNNFAGIQLMTPEEGDVQKEPYKEPIQ